MKKIIISIIIGFTLSLLHAQNDDANLIQSNRGDIYFLQTTDIYVTNGIVRRPVTYFSKNAKGKNVEIPFTWQGTGFLLDDGRLVTSRHCVQPWRYTNVPEILRSVAYVDSRQGYRIEATIRATSIKESFTFKASDFTLNDSRDEKQQLGAYDDGMPRWTLSAITSRDPQVLSTDWAYIKTSLMGKLTADSALSNNMKANTELHILGFVGKNTVSTDKKVADNPIYTRSRISYDGIEDGGYFSYINDKVEYSGSPILVMRNNHPVVVGVTTYSAAQGGGRKYAVPISGLTVKNVNSLSTIDTQEDIPAIDIHRLIEKTVSDGFFMVRQRYRLRNKMTNTYYGWNNEPYFSTVYSLAIRTVNGYYVSDAAIHPWEYDTRYDQYRSDKNFEPGTTVTSIRQLSVRAWRDLSIDDKACIAVSDMPLAWVKSADFDNTGFMPADKNIDDNSWVVWLASGLPLAAWSVSTADTISFSYITYISRHRFENGKTVSEIPTPDAGARKLIGGICLVPYITGLGQVEFRISGILTQKGGKWYAVQPQHVDVSSQPIGNGKLTPVDVSNKRGSDAGKKKDSTRYDI